MTTAVEATTTNTIAAKPGTWGYFWHGLKETWGVFRELQDKEGATKGTALERFQKALKHSEDHIDKKKGVIGFLRQLLFSTSDELQKFKAQVEDEGKFEAKLKKQFAEGKLKHDNGNPVQQAELDNHIDEKLHRETINRARWSKLDTAVYIWSQLSSMVSIPGDLFGILFDGNYRGSHIAGLLNSLAGMGIWHLLQKQGFAIQMGANFAWSGLVYPLISRMCSGLDKKPQGGNIPPEVLQMLMQQQGGLQGQRQMQIPSNVVDMPQRQPQYAGVAAA
ncbi:MAG: hypothetical protein SFT81_07045 [Candidatus Caenarcaniphilales bacterium]|nr:hypothetical protein [Candidatus Caenarcaniphilales bacterium]